MKTTNTDSATQQLVARMNLMIEAGYTREDCKRALEAAKYDGITIILLMDMLVGGCTYNQLKGEG